MDRIQGIRSFFLFLLVLLVGRIGWVAVVDGGAYAKAAVAQRSQTIPIRTSRGIIYDRNMLPLTEGQNSLWVAVVPDQCDNLDEVSRILGRPIVGNKVQLFPLQADIPQREKLFAQKGVMTLNIADRYMQGGLLSHVIGYQSENGGFGIEKAMNSDLYKNTENEFLIVNSAQQRAISGLGLKIKSEKGLSGVKLTIDYHIQQICEQVMDKRLPKGAVIVADAKNGDILAMASRPNFTQDNIADYLNGTDGELINRAICAYDIGSVFKIVITAAALCEGLITPDDEILCTGKYKIAGKDFYCSKTDGHGLLPFKRAFAYSCNIPFYILGQELGMEKIYQYATDFGFGSPVLNIQLGESSGMIPSSPYTLPGEVANASIGQGKVQVTPLQVVSMLCTIANGGIKKQLNLVDSIVEEDGIHLINKKAQSDVQIIPTEVAKTIMQLMAGVVTEGSGKMAKPDFWSAGGKTSSAESGWSQNGQLLIHGWFAGFFPAEEPRYICVVLAEDGRRGGTSAAPVFKEIGDEIYKLYK